jgi:hypothetical protein
MNLHNRSGDNDKNKSNGTSILSTGGAIVIAAILIAGGFAMIPQAVAQENITDTTPQPMLGAQNPCDPTLFADMDQNATADTLTMDQQQDNATMGQQQDNATMGQQQDTLTMGDNVTTPGVTEQNQTLDRALHNELRLYIENACLSLQINDIQGAVIQLDQALNALEAETQPTTLPNMTAFDTQNNVTGVTPDTETGVQEGGGFQPEPGTEPQPEQEEDGGFLGGIFG